MTWANVFKIAPIILLGLALPSGSAAAKTAALRLASAPVAFEMRDVEYLQVAGRTFQATVYQPEGSGPFPVMLDVHGGAWVREDVSRDEVAAGDVLTA